MDEDVKKEILKKAHKQSAKSSDMSITEPPEITAITLLCFCHGSVPIQLTPHVGIDRKTTGIDDMQNFHCNSRIILRNPVVQQYSCDYIVDGTNYFSFRYSTVDFQGHFMNAGSCLGFPVAPTSQEPYEVQTRVSLEENQLKEPCANPPCILYDNVRELCRSNRFKNVDFSTREEFKDDDHTCLSLFMHDNKDVKSLLYKEYTSYDDETKLKDGTESPLDVYKFIMLVALNVGGSVIVHKTILLGNGYENSLDELAALTQKKSVCDEYKSSVLTRTSKGRTSYNTTTEDIIKFVNKLSEENTKLNFYDKSCNTVFNYATSPVTKLQVDPAKSNYTLQLINHYLNFEQYAEFKAFFGGKCTRKMRKTRTRK